MLEVELRDARIRRRRRHPLGEAEHTESWLIVRDIVQCVKERLAMSDHKDVGRAARLPVARAKRPSAQQSADELLDHGPQRL